MIMVRNKKCVRCGFCCKVVGRCWLSYGGVYKDPVEAAMNREPKACPWLNVSDTEYTCVLAKGKKNKEELGIGEGCEFPDNPWRVFKDRG